MSSNEHPATVLPVEPSCAAPSPIPPARVLWDVTLPGGTHWSGVLRRGTGLRIIDQAGGANLAAVFYHREDLLERYSMADTLKAQHTAYLTRGFVLYSDMGRVLCSITEDALGWHDPLGGVGDAALSRTRYGVGRYQEQRNAMIRNGRDSLLIELGKYGLGERDLVANVNFFSKVTVAPDGAMRFVEGHSFAGASVDLRFEMPTLAAFSTAPHPLDTTLPYRPGPVRLIAYRAELPGVYDYCRNFRPENVRGFLNTEALYL